MKSASRQITQSDGFRP